MEALFEHSFCHSLGRTQTVIPIQKFLAMKFFILRTLIVIWMSAGIAYSCSASGGDKDGSDTIDDREFWMSRTLFSVNWTEFMDENAEFLTPQQRKHVLGVSGYHNLNPLLLIDELMVEEESDPAALEMSDQAFLKHLDEIANSTEILYLETETASEKPKNNFATSAVWNLMEQDDSKLDNFVSNYKTLFDKTGLSHSDFNYNSTDGVVTRISGGFQWPWQGSLSTGACHGNTGSGFTASAFDPQDGTPWGGNGQVVTAAHNGWAYPTSSCGITIVSDGYNIQFETGYYHLVNIRVQWGQQVSAGQILANAATSFEQAICAGGATSGPHLHFTFFNQLGHPQTWNNQILSGYTITAIITNGGYETGCNNCYVQKDGVKYCVGDRIPSS